MRKQNNSFPDYVLDYHHYFSSVADEGNIHLTDNSDFFKKP